jgi:hypothetical protein
MNILKKKNRNQSIESLEFFYFLQELFLSLVGEYGKSTNPLILDFLKVLEGFYSWESKKIGPYTQALTDFVFWKSKEFYRETMQKFVVGELNALEFAQEFSDRLLAEKAESNILLEDFQKQADIELNPKSFQFSKIILNFELLLEVYQNEMEELEVGDQLSENDLSFTEDSLKEGVRRELEKVNQYFTD